MEKKGLRVYTWKKMILVLGNNLDLLQKYGKDPCGVCQIISKKQSCGTLYLSSPRLCFFIVI